MKRTAGLEAAQLAIFSFGCSACSVNIKSDCFMSLMLSCEKYLGELYSLQLPSLTPVLCLFLNQEAAAIAAAEVAFMLQAGQRRGFQVRIAPVTPPATTVPVAANTAPPANPPSDSAQ